MFVSRAERVLSSSSRDGTYPAGGVTFGAAGNLYGTTSGGGIFNYGTVFELSPAGGGSWTKTTLHAFDTGSGGYGPAAGVILDSAGNLYGTAAVGGPGTNCIDGCGVVFELMPRTGGSWTIRTLHAFDNNGKDGFFPQAGLIFDSAGNLYGTTFYGGANTGCYDNEFTCGTAFELERTASGGFTEKVLHDFGSKESDGQNPVAPLTLDGAGNLYGTTTFGGGTFGDGTVFEVTP